MRRDFARMRAAVRKVPTRFYAYLLGARLLPQTTPVPVVPPLRRITAVDVRQKVAQLDDTDERATFVRLVLLSELEGMRKRLLNEGAGMWHFEDKPPEPVVIDGVAMPRTSREKEIDEMVTAITACLRRYGVKV